MGTSLQSPSAWAERDHARHMIETECDAGMRAMAEEELKGLAPKEAALTEEVRSRFVLDDEEASKDVIMEIRAGTGGDEAALFASDLFGMYRRYAEGRGWKVELIDVLNALLAYDRKLRLEAIAAGKT